jgi:hypothetical protein
MGISSIPGFRSVSYPKGVEISENILIFQSGNCDVIPSAGQMMSERICTHQIPQYYKVVFGALHLAI